MMGCSSQRWGAGGVATHEEQVRSPASGAPPDGRRRRDGVPRATPSRREKKNEPKRRAGTWGAPFGYLALFWTLAAFSFFWRAAQSEAERPSGTYLGVFKYRERARVRGQLNGVARAPSLRKTIIYSGSILCSCARRGRRPRATASHRCFFHSSAAIPPRCAGPGGTAPRVGGAPGSEAAQLVCRTLHEHPFTATLGLETLRGAKAVALPARAIIRAAFMTANLPPLLVCLTDQDYMSTSLHLRSMQARGPYLT